MNTTHNTLPTNDLTNEISDDGDEANGAEQTPVRGRSSASSVPDAVTDRPTQKAGGDNMTTTLVPSANTSETASRGTGRRHRHGAQPVSSSNHDAVLLASPHRHRRRRVAALLVALVAIFGSSLLATSQPATAASGGQVCFKSVNGGISGGSGINIKTEAYIYGTWQQIRSDLTNSQGCIALTANGAVRNYYLRFAVAHYGRGFRLVSAPTAYMSPGNSFYNLGNLYARCYQTTFGVVAPPCPFGTGNWW